MIRSYREADLHDTLTLVRMDLNVSFKDGAIVDESRLVQAAESLKILQELGAKLLVLSHLGRPKGQVVAEYSLEPLAARLGALLGTEVKFALNPMDIDDASLAAGDVVLIENTRFCAGEEKNDPDFAKFLAGLGKVYINDAFSAAHRAHASTEGVAHHLPSYAGPALLREIEALEQVLVSPKSPTVGVIGGSKISTKISVIENLLPKLDQLIIGGAMANTFLYAAGYSVGRSLYEPEATDIIADIHAKALSCGCEIILPKDLHIAAGLEDHAGARTVGLDACPDDAMILDIGHNESLSAMKSVLGNAKTVLWNGPFGAFEYPPFDTATNDIANFVAAQTQAGHCVSVAGGGDTLAALRHAKAAEGFSYVSTAGGAFLEWLEGKTLPGIAVLDS